MPRHTNEPADKLDPETCKALADKLVAARREAMAREAAHKRWEGEWWKPRNKPQKP